MCGSWDSCGVKQGPMDSLGDALYPKYPTWNWQTGEIEQSIDTNALAASWKVELADSLLVPPSDVCDFSSSCGPGEAFECDDIDRRELQVEVSPDCARTCDDIEIEQFRDQCEAGEKNTFDSSFYLPEPIPFSFQSLR